MYLFYHHQAFIVSTTLVLMMRLGGGSTAFTFTTVASRYHCKYRSSSANVCRHRLYSQTNSNNQEVPIATTTTTTTQYTINDDLCPPTKPDVLQKTIRKSCDSLELFLSKKPIAAHTQKAFDQVSGLIDHGRPIVLDSGCGTARSTLLLADKFPNHTIVGVDRSFVRLVRNANSRGDTPMNMEDEQQQETTTDDGDIDDNNNNDASLRPYYQQVGPNAVIVRAELMDFWRLVLQANNSNDNQCWNIEHHYLLYPNPYPTKARLKQRFYAHSSFPLLLQVGGEITIRSNWKGYLQEFAQSVLIANDYYHDKSTQQGQQQQHDDDVTEGDHPHLMTTKNVNVARPYVSSARHGPQERTDKTVAWTNFERKYDTVGEPTYELRLTRREPSNDDDESDS